MRNPNTRLTRYELTETALDLNYDGLGYCHLCCVSLFHFTALLAVAGSSRDANMKYRPGMFPLCSLMLIVMTELFNHETDLIPMPNRTNLLIVFMRIGLTLSTLWGLRFILLYRRNDAQAVTWAILASVLVGIYWVAVAIGTFPALT